MWPIGAMADADARSGPLLVQRSVPNAVLSV